MGPINLEYSRLLGIYMVWRESSPKYLSLCPSVQRHNQVLLLGRSGDSGLVLSSMRVAASVMIKVIKVTWLFTSRSLRLTTPSVKEFDIEVN